MSMISEQVKELRKAAKWFEGACFPEAVKLVGEAADIIESLSAKLTSANEELKCWHTDRINDKIKNPFVHTSTLICHNCDHKDEYIEELEAVNTERSEAHYNDGWIYCGDGKNLPEEKINPVTKDFCEYQVTFECDDVSDIRHYKFGNDHWWNGPEIMDKYVTAWRVPIKPFVSHL